MMVTGSVDDHWMATLAPCRPTGYGDCMGEHGAASGRSTDVDGEAVLPDV